MSLIRSPAAASGRRCTGSPSRCRAAGTAARRPRAATAPRAPGGSGTRQLHVDQRVGERLDVGGLPVGQGRRVAGVGVADHVRRSPPGFMKAIWRPGRPRVAQRCTSATRLPSVDSPPRFSVPPSAFVARLNGPLDLAELDGTRLLGVRDGLVDDRLDLAGRPRSRRSSTLIRIVAGRRRARCRRRARRRSQLVEEVAVLAGGDDRAVLDDAGGSAPTRRPGTRSCRPGGCGRRRSRRRRRSTPSMIGAERGARSRHGGAVGGRRALVDEQHHQVGAGGLELGGLLVGGGHDVGDLEALDALGR